MDVSRLFARAGRLYLDGRQADVWGPCRDAASEVTDVRVVTDLLTAIGDRPTAFAELKTADFDDKTTTLGCLQWMLALAVYGILMENPYIKFWYNFDSNVDDTKLTRLADAACEYFWAFPTVEDRSAPQIVQSVAQAIMARRGTFGLDYLYMQLFSTPGIDFEQAGVRANGPIDDYFVQSITAGLVQLMLARPKVQAEQARRLATAH